MFKKVIKKYGIKEFLWDGGMWWDGAGFFTGRLRLERKLCRVHDYLVGLSIMIEKLVCST